MSSAIKAIDKTTVHRICSGQVVLSLGIAVKELVENAIDAGATSVEVKLREYGSELIEVSDNGHGVHPENFEGLTLKHHTSKLRDFSDLMGVETFGFRGEALSSLCALSELSVSTRHKSMNCGSAIKFDRSGKILENKPCARQIGTTVSLSNIFHTLPVRHKEFNRNLKKEFNKMLQLLYAYCMVSTEVRITCTNQTKKGNKNVVVATQGSNSVKENVSCIFGAKQLSSLLELKTTLPPPEELDELKADEGACSIFQLDGLVSSCAHGSGRSTPDRQFYFINSRPCDPSKVSKAVNEIYHHYNLHQYPFVYLNINVAHESVDVNVTPDKRQLFLDNEKLLIAIIKASLDRVYKNIPSTFILNNIPIKTTSPASVPKTDNAKPNLSLFSQWRSKNDCFKRTLEDSDCEADKRKVIKLEDDHRKQSTQPKLRKFVTKTPSVDREEEGLNDFSGHLAADHLESLENSELTNDTNIILSKSELCKSSALKHEDNNSEEGAPVNTCSNTGLVAYFSVVDDIVREESASPVPTSWSLDTATHSLPTVEIQPTPETSEGLESAPMEILEEYLENYSSSESFITAETLTLSQSMSSKSVIYDSYEERGKRCVTIPMDISRLKTLCKKWVKRDNTIEKVRFRAAIDPSKNDQAEDELKKEITKDKFQVMEIIGQFNLGFIITKLDTDLFIIDQHAADEKFNFETLQKNTVIKNQKLVVPQQLELTAANESVLMDNLEVFKKNGFEFRINEDAPPTKKVSMTAVPLSVNRVFGKEDVDELIFMLQDVSDGDVNCRPSGVRAMFASRACRKSVMVGTALDSKEMKRLVFQMGTIEHPWNCPHGRPTMRHLVNMELVKKI